MGKTLKEKQQQFKARMPKRKARKVEKIQEKEAVVEMKERDILSELGEFVYGVRNNTR